MPQPDLDPSMVSSHSAPVTGAVIISIINKSHLRELWWFNTGQFFRLIPRKRTVVEVVYHRPVFLINPTWENRCGSGLSQTSITDKPSEKTVHVVEVVYHRPVLLINPTWENCLIIYHRAKCFVLNLLYNSFFLLFMKCTKNMGLVRSAFPISILCLDT